MRLTTTLTKIRACSPCSGGWRTLNEALGSKFDPDAEINLLKILETNGVQDMIWCLRATKEDSKKVASQLAIEFAEQVLPIFEARWPNDNRPRAAIKAARDFAAGKITREELITSRAAAYTAAYADAVTDAAYTAACAAAYSYAACAAAAVTDAVVYAADAADAADAAAARKDMKDRQVEIIRGILE